MMKEKPSKNQSLLTFSNDWKSQKITCYIYCRLFYKIVNLLKLQIDTRGKLTSINA